MKNLIVLLICVVIFSCAPTSSLVIKPIYLDSGQMAMSVKCSEESDCLQEAGNICGTDGYNIAYNTNVDKGTISSSSGSATQVFGTVIANSSESTLNINEHHIMFNCKTLNTYNSYITFTVNKNGKEFVDIDGNCFWNKTMGKVSSDHCRFGYVKDPHHVGLSNED